MVERRGSDGALGDVRSVLVVDDEKNMRQTLASILRLESWEVVTARSGEEAVELCRQREFDVVLMDVRMPGITGVEAFRQIRSERHDARVILMSAYSAETLKEASLKEGVVAFLSKPLDVEQVIRLVERIHDTNILVIGESEDVQRDIVSVLEAQTYRVTRMGSPNDALALVEQIRFDVVFIDAAVRSVNIVDLYLSVRKANQSITAVIIAAPAEEDAARRAVERTAYAYLSRPIDSESVVRLVDRIKRERASGTVCKPETVQ